MPSADREGRGAGQVLAKKTSSILGFVQGFCLVQRQKRVLLVRRSGRVAEGGGLENRCAREGTVGSNPTSSATSVSPLLSVLFSPWKSPAPALQPTTAPLPGGSVVIDPGSRFLPFIEVA